MLSKNFFENLRIYLNNSCILMTEELFFLEERGKDFIFEYL